MPGNHSFNRFLQGGYVDHGLLNTSVDDVRVTLDCALRHGDSVKVLERVTACFKEIEAQDFEEKTRRKVMATAMRKALKQLGG